MEIIKINLNAIKIILDKEECEKYEFISDTELSDTEMLTSLNALLSEIDKKTGINFKDERLLVQVYVSKDGGCEIYICNTEGEKMYKDRIAPYGAKRTTVYRSVFRFDSLDKILSACHRLRTLTDEENSEVYYDEEKEKYYLVCQNISSKELRYSFLNEYAKQLKAPAFYYIKEHLRCLCKSNAINIFSSLV